MLLKVSEPTAPKPARLQDLAPNTLCRDSDGDLHLIVETHHGAQSRTKQAVLLDAGRSWVRDDAVAQHILFFPLPRGTEVTLTQQ